MKSNNEKDANLMQLEWWYHDIEYLLKKFGSIIKELELKLFEVSSQYVKFKTFDCDIIFQYDVNRYGSGRTLVDIVIHKDKEAMTKRLSELIYYDKSSENLNKLIAQGSNNNIPPIDVYEKLFRKYLYELALNCQQNKE